MMIWPTSNHNDFRYSWCAFLLVRRNPLIVPESTIGGSWKTHPPDSEWWKSPGIWIGISSMEVAPFSGEGAIMFVIPVPLKRNTPFRRSWWTHSHIQLTLRVSIADPQTTTRQQNVTRFSRSVASLDPLSWCVCGLFGGCLRVILNVLRVTFWLIFKHVIF